MLGPNNTILVTQKLNEAVTAQSKATNEWITERDSLLLQTDLGWSIFFEVVNLSLFFFLLLLFLWQRVTFSFPKIMIIFGRNQWSYGVSSSNQKGIMLWRIKKEKRLVTKGGPVKIVHPLEISGAGVGSERDDEFHSLTSPVLNSEERSRALLNSLVRWWALQNEV